MSKVMGILSIATKVMLFIVATAVAAVSLTTAYIMFAPDEFPKPFRLVYNLTGSPQTVAISQSGTTTGGGEGSGSSTEGGSDPAAEPTEVPAGSGVMVNMATKIINLADPSGRKYIRLTMVLEFAPPTGEAAKASSGGEGASAQTPEQLLQTELTALLPVMDDAVITLLSTKTYEELYTAQGKEGLRTELRDAIQAKLPEYKLMNVYFTEFVVQ